MATWPQRLPTLALARGHLSKKVVNGHMAPSKLNVRPPDKSVFHYFSSKTYVVGTQKNCLNEKVLLSTQYTHFN